MSLFFFAQWGSGPNIVGLYDPRVIRAIGSANLAGAWLADRTLLLTLAPRIKAVYATRLGTLVIASLLSQTSAPLHESFLFVPSPGGWHLLSDSLTETFLGPYVQSVVQNLVAPTAQKASPRAVSAGLAAIQKYRALSLPQPQLANGA